MIPLTEERKQQIIDEEPQGLWLVLREEYPQGGATAGDLVSTSPMRRPRHDAESPPPNVPQEGRVDHERLHSVLARI
jgi:hypothetical protein